MSLFNLTRSIVHVRQMLTGSSCPPQYLEGTLHLPFAKLSWHRDQTKPDGRPACQFRQSSTSQASCARGMLALQLDCIETAAYPTPPRRKLAEAVVTNSPYAHLEPTLLARTIEALLPNVTETSKLA